MRFYEKNTASIANQMMRYDADAVKQNVNGFYVIVVKEHSLGVFENQNTNDALLRFENGSLKDILFEHYNVCIEPVLQRFVAAWYIGLTIHHNSKYFRQRQHR